MHRRSWRRESITSETLGRCRSKSVSPAVGSEGRRSRDPGCDPDLSCGATPRDPSAPLAPSSPSRLRRTPSPACIRPREQSARSGSCRPGTSVCSRAGAIGDSRSRLRGYLQGGRALHTEPRTLGVRAAAGRAVHRIIRVKAPAYPRPPAPAAPSDTSTRAYLASSPRRGGTRCRSRGWRRSCRTVRLCWRRASTRS